ncbi:hypothetical protein Taro_017138 [Colocasia esculenta]|uniref:E3 ubiquitin-protein ligase ARIH1-like UBA-like domain-containing protein n=1 Tax=Colocasia esculenta TaxID=4460 RepID=A0A843UYH6_COLES|nr:hypothetical protein [Colocasia esculenta]
MDSEDGVHDTNDLKTVDDDFYSGGTGSGTEEGDGDYDFVENDSDESDDAVSHRHQNYLILSEADIRQHQEEDINRISQVLSIPKVDACILLRIYKWSVSKVHDAWFADEESVRKAMGLLEKAIEMPKTRELTCGICFEDYSHNKMSSAACGHPFCDTCWRATLLLSILDAYSLIMSQEIQLLKNKAHSHHKSDVHALAASPSHNIVFSTDSDGQDVALHDDGMRIRARARRKFLKFVNVYGIF